MARNNVCPDCGRKFDVDLVAQIYNEKYAPDYTYDGLSEEFCLACAYLYTDQGVVNRANSYGTEREPDI